MNIENQLDLGTVLARPGTKRILVVEDEPHWQVLISRSLRAVDKEIGIRCVGSAREAQLILYKDTKIDMVIVDYHLADDSTTGVKWHRDLDTARELARIEEKPLFVAFSARQLGEYASPYY